LHSDDVSSKAPSVDYKFVLFILTVIFPELRLVYFPLGTLVLLPGGRQKESRKNLARNFGAKNEIGSEKEIESFVVSTSTVAIETLPSRVRIPETQKLNCFKSGKRRRNSFESSSTSVIQKD
jgi:lauroyl/myristoyl acyltransferase